MTFPPHSSVGQLCESDLEKLLNLNFPPMDFAFGYGSGVFKQIGYDYTNSSSLPVLDLFFIVQDADDWHRLNLIQNPSHYSGLGYYLGSPYLQFLQEHIIPVHFNPGVQMKILCDEKDEQLTKIVSIKYGVVDSKVFARDLSNWDILSCSGRLHKPVKIIHTDFFAKRDLENNLHVNLVQAASIGLLLNFGSRISMREFLVTVASLSYVGDVRFAVGAENTKKVENIVDGNYLRFVELYKKILIETSPLNEVVQIRGNDEENDILMDCSEQSVVHLIESLPSGLRIFTRPHEMKVKTINLEDVQRQIVAQISSINKGSSSRLVFYNIFATSPIKNIAYVFQKLKKGILKR